MNLVRAAALSAALALLQAAAVAQSSASFYGVVDANVRVDHNGAGTETSIGSGLSRGSRVGFRSREDLGQGLHLLAMAEMGISVDTGDVLATGAPAPSWGRQLWVGAGNADAGMVAVGRQYTPLFAVSAGALAPWAPITWAPSRPLRRCKAECPHG